MEVLKASKFFSLNLNFEITVCFKPLLSLKHREFFFRLLIKFSIWY